MHMIHNTFQQDRFINNLNKDKASCKHVNNNALPLSFLDGMSNANYHHLIKKSLFCNAKDRVNIFYQDENTQVQEFQMDFKPPEKLKKINSHVQSPVKILDAPKYRDDFYLNNIDWAKEGHLGIALDKEVFLYTPESINEIGKAYFNSYISGIKIEESIMAVGLSSGSVDIYDIQRNFKVRSLNNHKNRVSSLAFMNNNILITGSKDRSIIVNDLRQRENVVKTFDNHTGEVLAIKVKSKFQDVFASGSTDGSAIVWDVKYGKIDQYKGHKGAVKALDWCPWKNGVLATAGGNLENKSIKIWNTINSKLVSSQQIEKQISSLIWNEQYKCLSAANGEEINFWNLKNTQNKFKLQMRRKFRAHNRRILNLVQSHDQNYLCSIGGDEDLKFWRLSPQNSNPFSYEQSKNEKAQFFRV